MLLNYAQATAALRAMQALDPVGGTATFSFGYQSLHQIGDELIVIKCHDSGRRENFPNKEAFAREYGLN